MYIDDIVRNKMKNTSDYMVDLSVTKIQCQKWKVRYIFNNIFESSTAPLEYGTGNVLQTTYIYEF